MSVTVHVHECNCVCISLSFFLHHLPFYNFVIQNTLSKCWLIVVVFIKIPLLQKHFVINTKQKKLNYIGKYE